MPREVDMFTFGLFLITSLPLETLVSMKGTMFSSASTTTAWVGPSLISTFADPASSTDVKLSTLRVSLTTLPDPTMAPGAPDIVEQAMAASRRTTILRATFPFMGASPSFYVLSVAGPEEGGPRPWAGFWAGQMDRAQLCSSDQGMRRNVSTGDFSVSGLPGRGKRREFSAENDDKAYRDCAICHYPDRVGDRIMPR